MAKREPIPAEKILRVFRRDKFTCQYCGATGTDLEIDHVIPVALGGSNSEINLVTACRKCNRKKGKKLIVENLIRDNDKNQIIQTNDHLGEIVSKPGHLTFRNGDVLIDIPDTPENKKWFNEFLNSSIKNERTLAMA